MGGRGLHAETAVGSDSLLEIGPCNDLTSIILIVLGTVNLQVPESDFSYFFEAHSWNCDSLCCV